MENVKITVGEVTKEYQYGTTFEVIARDFSDGKDSKSYC